MSEGRDGRAKTERRMRVSQGEGGESRAQTSGKAARKNNNPKKQEMERTTEPKPHTPTALANFVLLGSAMARTGGSTRPRLASNRSNHTSRKSESSGCVLWGSIFDRPGVLRWPSGIDRCARTTPALFVIEIASATAD